MSIIQDLEKIGLPEKEAKVYLAALELGQSTVQEIGKKSGVNRATTYVILESLSKKGLVSSFTENKKTYFVASQPESLMGLFELQKKEIEEKQRYFQIMLKELKALRNLSSDKPTIEYFEGKEGAINCYRESYQTVLGSQDALTLYPKDRIDEVFNEKELNEFRSTRLKNKIRTRVLYSSKNKTLESNANGLRIKIDQKKYPLHADIAIYGNLVRFTTLREKLSAVLIRDKDIADTLKSLFNLAWERANDDKKTE